MESSEQFSGGDTTIDLPADGASLTKTIHNTDVDNGLSSEEETFEDALDELKLTDAAEDCSSSSDDEDSLQDQLLQANVSTHDSMGAGNLPEVSACKIGTLTSDSEDVELEQDPDISDEESEAAKPVPVEEIVIDEAALKEQESQMTDEEKLLRREEALRLKELGNSQFTAGCYEAAVSSYTDALASCLLCHSGDRAIIYSNRAAAKMRLEKNDSAISDCTKALEFNPDYMKARLRRAELYEKTDKLDEALEDYTKALERDPSLHNARAACMRLPDKIKERNEKLKEEMMGKLKDLGNMILRPFGLSTSNFKLQQDPSTGSYSVSFQQNTQ